MTSTLVLIFKGHNISPSIPTTTIPLPLAQHLSLTSYKYNYSISSNPLTLQINVTPCSIATCESISNATTSNKVYQVLFDSGSSKTLIHKHIVPQDFISISSDNDWLMFLLVGATTSTALMALEKIRFHEFNWNMIVDKHPVLIVDSANLCYDIIFGSNFLDKCGITLNYENHQVQCVEYTIPLCDA